MLIEKWKVIQKVIFLTSSENFGYKPPCIIGKVACDIFYYKLLSTSHTLRWKAILYLNDINVVYSTVGVSTSLTNVKNVQVVYRWL